MHSDIPQLIMCPRDMWKLSVVSPQILNGLLMFWFFILIFCRWAVFHIEWHYIFLWSYCTNIGNNHSLKCSVSLDKSISFTYQWKKNDVVVLNQTSSTISFSPLWEADVERYNCLMSVDSMTNTSNDVIIIVETKCNGSYWAWILK